MITTNCLKYQPANCSNFAGAAKETSQTSNCSRPTRQPGIDTIVRNWTARSDRLRLRRAIIESEQSYLDVTNFVEAMPICKKSMKAARGIIVNGKISAIKSCGVCGQTEETVKAY